MPTTRRRRARGRITAPLGLSLTDLLLDGKTRSAEEVETLKTQGVEYDVWIEFDDFDLPALWRAYRAELLAEWKHRGGSGLPWAARFDNDNPPDGTHNNGGIAS